MSGLQALLDQRIKPEGPIKLVVSERFLDENQKPVEWEISGITRAQNKMLRSRCMKWVPRAQDEGMAVPEMDYDEYALLLAVHCTVVPDLHDAALQKSHGAQSAEELLKAMLLPGELQSYETWIQEYFGFGPHYEAELETAMDNVLRDGDHDAVLAYQCLSEFHWSPSALMSMSLEERAFLFVAMNRIQKEREKRKKQTQQSAKRRG